VLAGEKKRTASASGVQLVGSGHLPKRGITELPDDQARRLAHIGTGFDVSSGWGYQTPGDASNNR
jgi:hypothetical protein